jgi:hypothetical protein
MFIEEVVIGFVFHHYHGWIRIKSGGKNSGSKTLPLSYEYPGSRHTGYEEVRTRSHPLSGDPADKATGDTKRDTRLRAH